MHRGERPTVKQKGIESLNKIRNNNFNQVPFTFVDEENDSGTVEEKEGGNLIVSFLFFCCL